MATAISARARRGRSRLILATVAVLALHSVAHAADRHYVGPDNGSWSNPANWSATPGGPGGAGVPGNGDNARLSSAVVKTIVFDGSYSAPGLNSLFLSEVTNGATVTLNQSANGMYAFEENICFATGASAVYHQTGGNNTVTTDFHMARDGRGTGNYVLDGGALQVGETEYLHRGSFTQNGGTNSAHDLSIALSAGETGQFTLNNGPISIVDYLKVAEQGTATFDQTGG